MPRVKSNVMPELSGVFVNIYGAPRCVRRGREASLIMPFYSSASLLLLGATEHFSPPPSLPLSLSHPLILLSHFSSVSFIFSPCLLSSCPLLLFSFFLLPFIPLSLSFPSFSLSSSSCLLLPFLPSSPLLSLSVFSFAFRYFPHSCLIPPFSRCLHYFPPHILTFCLFFLFSFFILHFFLSSSVWLFLVSFSLFFLGSLFASAHRATQFPHI